MWNFIIRVNNNFFGTKQSRIKNPADAGFFKWTAEFKDSSHLYDGTKFINAIFFIYRK